MENKRTQLADEIRSTAQLLNELIEQAKAEGLNVEIYTNNSSLNQSSQFLIAVMITAITEY